MKQFSSRWLPLVLWAAFIFTLSSIPEPLDQTPSALALVLQDMRFLGFRMVAVVSFIIHFTLYLALGFLAVSASIAEKEVTLPLLLSAFLVCILYALSDEFHQQFVPGRGFEWVDLLADGVGSVIGIVLKLKGES
jgi:VanZ family protein